VDNIQERLIAVLNRAAVSLRRAALPGDLGLRMEALATQVRQPCTVAVVGPVKAGKSTFVNALLGGDHAKVGTTETTATINYFTYVDPKDYDSDRPIRCHWRGGAVSNESRAFLDDLQGNDLETLRRADGIAHLEYLLPNAFLKQITLVDTPGTGAVIDEHHDKTAEFMRLNSELRDRHDRETRRFNDTADAIIYLVGPVAKVSNEKFLEAFAEAAGGSSALNAIGVLSKIELQPEVMARRHEFSATVASQLKDKLNTVIPVAAGLRRELDSLLKDDERFSQLIITLRRIPPAWLDTLLDSDELFRDFDSDDLPISTDVRRKLVGDMPWGVFATIARVAADSTLSHEDVVKSLEGMCGFGPLWEALYKRFIQRGHILRCYRITRDAQGMLNRELKYTYLPRRREEGRRARERLNRFLAFIDGAEGDAATADELREFVRANLDATRQASKLEELHASLDFELSTLLYQLQDHNADFEALQKLGSDTHMFSADEMEELRPLLGLYGSGIEKRLPPGRTEDIEYVGWRQTYWRVKKMEVPYGTVEYSVADRAFTRYGVILSEISENVTAAIPRTLSSE
jgi:hypothetical protein